MDGWTGSTIFLGEKQVFAGLRAVEDVGPYRAGWGDVGFMRSWWTRNARPYDGFSPLLC